jgi:2-keto-myo-inositol isomerase
MDLGNFLTNLKEIGYRGMVSIETFRPEYWREKPEWVIREAYRSTSECMRRCGVL